MKGMKGGYVVDFLTEKEKKTASAWDRDVTMKFKGNGIRRIHLLAKKQTNE